MKVDVRIYAIGDRVVIDEELEGMPPVTIVVTGAEASRIGSIFLNTSSIAANQSPDKEEPSGDEVTLGTLPR